MSFDIWIDVRDALEHGVLQEWGILKSLNINKQILYKLQFNWKLLKKYNNKQRYATTVPWVGGAQDFRRKYRAIFILYIYHVNLRVNNHIFRDF